MLDAAEVDAVTGWAVGAATPASRSEPTPVRLCHFTDVDHRGTVQVVVADDVGDAPYVAARQALAANPTVGDAVVPGASAAFQAPFDGIVGMVVDGRFVEVTVAGVGLDQADHIELATIVAERP